MKEKSEEKPQFVNTQMPKFMFDWVTEQAWKARLTRSKYIRNLIQREMGVKEAKK